MNKLNKVFSYDAIGRKEHGISCGGFKTDPLPNSMKPSQALHKQKSYRELNADMRKKW